MSSRKHIQSVSQKFKVLANPSQLNATDYDALYIQFAAIFSATPVAFSSRQQQIAAIASAQKLEFDEYVDRNLPLPKISIELPEPNKPLALEISALKRPSQQRVSFNFKMPQAAVAQKIDNQALAQEFLDKFAAQKDDSGLAKALRLDYSLLDDIFCEFVE
ncbi:hypothetical protein SS50377_25026 [Spironucleus salmonicida]|uniref:Uncharacterized protein n=1 Tax=Spironucleus salmonicida TaxID=348837 RepID=V6LQP7_9EUKA|nr:hypothetical protein SS50377_25026 [Spironucleus salmonicida]|eukprot:EST43079.1 Hypothetical protein SS50377_17237 [Spironucleus salmonicida]